ncbi:hypothetical protein PWT90_05824 [Aphanocladium album]|nr:hypothetical protein PWT90_05824 [Aphanocladium album]
MTPEPLAPPRRLVPRRRVLLNHHHFVLGLGLVRHGRGRGRVVPRHSRRVPRRRLRDPHARHHGRHHGYMNRTPTTTAHWSYALRAADLEHFRLGAAAAMAPRTLLPVRVSSLVVSVAVVDVVVFYDDGARFPGGGGPRQKDGRVAGARVEEREEQQKDADGAEDDAGDSAGGRGGVLPAVGGGDGFEAGRVLRRARGDGVGMCEGGGGGGCVEGWW